MMVHPKIVEMVAARVYFGSVTSRFPFSDLEAEAKEYWLSQVHFALAALRPLMVEIAKEAYRQGFSSAHGLEAQIPALEDYGSAVVSRVLASPPKVKP